ncbi:AbrB family transcriptional regulator [Treponema phagedenis]|uniref:AbrB family transcriptional regulator n=1 Tax=Treponema phagedenis TaxID=162 RepID=UPI0001F63CDB|nr:AbrB family transcriptional regulator [Treponema phagedenis]EFW37673.1 putative membrane protein AbrB [Treponema phagedenis F0421]
MHSSILKIAVTFIFACFGGFLGIKLKIPAGAMIGALIATAAYNILSNQAHIPPNLKIIVQIVMGASIGSSFKKEVLVHLQELLVPIFMVVGCLLVFSLILGFIFYKLGRVDIITAFLSTSPGGLTDMTILADSYNADVKVVATVHTIRLTFVVILIPLVIKFISKLV